MIAFDQRWHGRGIRSDRFRFSDCADDVAAVMDELGVDQAIYRRLLDGRRDRPAGVAPAPRQGTGLVLCSTARNFRGLNREKFFFPVMTAVTKVLAGHALARVEGARGHPAGDTVHGPLGPGSVGFARSSAAPAGWSIPEVLGELGRFNSAAWVGEVDVPTAVVVTDRDHTIPERRQRKLAASIEGSTTFVAPGGHASIVLRGRHLGAAVP